MHGVFFEIILSPWLPLAKEQHEDGADLHDETAGGSIAPVIGVLKTKQDVLLLLHLHADHALNSP